VNKKVRKKVEGRCYFCTCDDYALLDVHRIVPGEEGGQYTDYNTVVVCSNCHRRCHSGSIKILGKHFSSSGKYVLNYIEDGVERWK
jgi:hypothetical protein